MNAHTGMQWDETLSNEPNAMNYITVPKTDKLYLGTAQAMPWADSGAHAPDNKVIPSAYIERLFKHAQVEAPGDLGTVRVIEKCLGITEYLDEAVGLLIEQGLFYNDQDGTEKVYDDYDDLCQEADMIVQAFKDDPKLIVTAESMEWLHDARRGAEEDAIKWFYEVTWKDMTAITNTLELYVELILTIGPRFTHEVRVDQQSVFYSMVGGTAGGQLLTAVRQYYHHSTPASVVIAPSLLQTRLAQFFFDTQWPAPYRQDYKDAMEYIFELPKRAAWKTATRQEWVTMVQNKLKKAITRDLPTLEQLLHDALDDSTRLVMEVQTIGDMLLEGEGAAKLPLWNIQEVEGKLARDHGALIASEREEGLDTDEILVKLKARLKQHSTQPTSKVEEGGDEFRGPKPGQMSKALGDKEYTRLEAQYRSVVEDQASTTVDKLSMLGDLLAAKPVLFKAVLFATKGVRMTAYVGGEGSDFLALLHGERHLLELLFGQTLAYDEDKGSVPEDLATFMLSQEEVRRLCDFAWEDLDPLNCCILTLKTEEAGTTFNKHDTRRVYHDSDMITNVADLYGKLFESIGYSKSVTEEEGYSFKGYMMEIKRILKFAMGLPPEEQKGAFRMIDDYVRRAYVAAAASAKRTIYGACPAERRLHAWISAEETVVLELRKTLGALKEHATHRRRMGSIFGNKPVAANLPGYSSVGGTSSGEEGAKKKEKTPKGKDKLETSGKRKGPSPTGSGGGKVTGAIAKKIKKSSVEAKRIFFYADGTYSIGKRNPSKSCTQARTLQHQHKQRMLGGWASAQQAPQRPRAHVPLAHQSLP